MNIKEEIKSFIESVIMRIRPFFSLIFYLVTIYTFANAILKRVWWAWLIFFGVIAAGVGIEWNHNKWLYKDLYNAGANRDGEAQANALKAITPLGMGNLFVPKEFKNKKIKKKKKKWRKKK